MDKTLHTINPTKYTSEAMKLTPPPADLHFFSGTRFLPENRKRMYGFDDTVPIWGFSAYNLFQYFEKDNHNTIGFLDCREKGTVVL